MINKELWDVCTPLWSLANFGDIIEDLQFKGSHNDGVNSINMTFDENGRFVCASISWFDPRTSSYEIGECTPEEFLDWLHRLITEKAGSLPKTREKNEAILAGFLAHLQANHIP